VITENNVKSGFSIDVLNEIATRRGWTITHGPDGPDGPVSGILKNVAEGRADAALGAIEITAERAKALDFSQPLYDGGLQILVPTGPTSRSLPGLAEFLQVLFSQTMLVWLADSTADGYHVAVDGDGQMLLARALRPTRRLRIGRAD